MSPTTIFSWDAVPVNTCVVAMGAGGVYPGVVGLGGYWGGLYRYLARYPPRTHI